MGNEIEVVSSDLTSANNQKPTPMQLVTTAVEKGMDVETIKGLMALQERWEANEAKKAFGVAMAEFKKTPINIIKSKEVSYSNTYYLHATLGDASTQIGAALSEHGLSHSWSICQKDGMVSVTCVITHRLGHSESVTMTAPPDDSGKKENIKAIASTVTYLERYTLLAATGTATKDQDNDGMVEPVGLDQGLLTEYADKIEAETEKEKAKQHYNEAVKLCEELGDIESANTLKAVLLAHAKKIDEINETELSE